MFERKVKSIKKRGNQIKRLNLNNNNHNVKKFSCSKWDLISSSFKNNNNSFFQQKTNLSQKAYPKQFNTQTNKYKKYIYKGECLHYRHLNFKKENLNNFKINNYNFTTLKTNYHTNNYRINCYSNNNYKINNYIAPFSQTNSFSSKRVKQKEHHRTLRKNIVKGLQKSIPTPLEENVKNLLTPHKLKGMINTPENCPGCGWKLQASSPNQLGYTIPVAKRLSKPKPKSKNDFRHLFESEVDLDEEFTLEEMENIQETNRLAEIEQKNLCQRCFQLKYNGKLVPVKVPFEDFRKNLSILSTADIIVLKVIDILDFSGSFVENFRDIIGDNPVGILANKADVLPNDIKFSRIKRWIRHQCNLQNLKVEDVYLTNSQTGRGIELLLKKLKRVRDGREIYVLGASNSGKSTFIKCLIEKFLDVNHNLKPPTTSPIPGTTLSIISVPIGKGAFIYDTPGIQNSNNISNFLLPSETKKVFPKKLKPICYSLVPFQTLFFGGLCRIDFLEGKRSNFVIWISSFLPIHATKTRYADELFKKHFKQEILIPPFEENHMINNLDNHFVFEIIGKNFDKASKDIAIPGLGWISIATKGSIKVKISVPKGITPILREPLLPYNVPGPKKQKKMRFIFRKEVQDLSSDQKDPESEIKDFEENEKEFINKVEQDEEEEEFDRDFEKGQNFEDHNEEGEEFDNEEEEEFDKEEEEEFDKEEEEEFDKEEEEEFDKEEEEGILDRDLERKQIDLKDEV